MRKKKEEITITTPIRTKEEGENIRIFFPKILNPFLIGKKFRAYKERGELILEVKGDEKKKDEEEDDFEKDFLNAEFGDLWKLMDKFPKYKIKWLV